MFKKGFEYVDEPYRSILKRLLDALLEIYGDELISLILFGSVARGDYRESSDIDLLIIVKGVTGGFSQRLRKFLKAEKMIFSYRDEWELIGKYVSLSPVILSIEEAKIFKPLYLDMVEDATILFDRDAFFENILYRLMDRLRELGAERIWIGRKWYWRLKKNYRFGEAIEIDLQ